MKYNAKFVEYPNDEPWNKPTVTRVTYDGYGELAEGLHEHGYGYDYAADMNENGLFGMKPNSYDTVEITIRLLEESEERERGKMTNREAIKEIQERIDFHEKQYPSVVPEYHDALKMAIAALEKQEKYEAQWHDDMGNPLEPIKITSALNSEIMKLEYRKEHKPEDISILDYTVIAALMECLKKRTEDAE